MRLISFLLLFSGAVCAMNSHRNSRHNSTSYKCSKGEIDFQYDNIDLVSPHICEPFGMMTPWQLTQMIYPDISVFLDVGANRGYTAAEFFGLWSPGHGLNRRSLRKALTTDAEKGFLKNKEQIDTYCKDGEKEDTPMICIGRHGAECLTRREITVYSFDGQATHVNESNGAIKHHFPQIEPGYNVNKDISKVKATWEYTHAAMTDVIPPGEEFGFFLVVTHEGGKLIKSQKEATPETALVRLMTVDKFCEDRKLAYVPILKIDAEGHDIEVIHGANKTLLHRGVKVLNYECWDCMSEAWQNTFHSLDVDFGFDCYQIGEYNMFVRLTNCWDYSVASKKRECAKDDAKCPEYVRNFEPKNRLDGNGMCIHRRRGAALHVMFENMSLHKYYNNARGDIHKDALLSKIKAKFNALGEILMPQEAIDQYKRRTGRNYITGVKEWAKRH